MTYIIGVVGQKGGTGKSTLSRAIARETIVNGWDTFIADMDSQQRTCLNWTIDRNEQNLEPAIPVESFSLVSQALKRRGKYELIIFDGAPHATEATKQIAENANLILLTTKTSKDDLNAQISVAMEMVESGIDPKRIAFVLSRVAEDGSRMAEDARGYIEQVRYAFPIIDGHLEERKGYEIAMNNGLAITETKYEPLNEKANVVIQSIFNLFSELIKEPEAA